MDKKITRERYLEVRQTLEFDEEFIYDVYLDSNPDKSLDIDGFFANLNNYLYWSDLSINELLMMIVNFYDVYFTVVTLKSGDGKVLKIF